MARAPSVSLDDVRGAIEVLKAQGVPDPGVHRIRALLGRGSVTTINAHKHRLRLDALERVLPGTRTRIPDPVTELAAQLWTQLNDQVDRVDAQREAEVNEALAQQKAAFADLQAAHAALQAETEQQAQQLATAQAQIAELTDARDAAQAAQQTAAHALEVLEAQQRTLAQERDSLKATLTLQAKHAGEREEALKQKLGEAQAQRLEERAQAEAERERLQADVAQWRGQAAQQHAYLTGQLAEQKTEVTQLRDALDAAQRAEKAHNESLACTQQAIDTLNGQLEELPACAKHTIAWSSSATTWRRHCASAAKNWHMCVANMPR